MTGMNFIGEWILRSSALILAGMLFARLFRIANPRTRLAIWIVLLAGSFAIPLMHSMLPGVPLLVMHKTAETTPRPIATITPGSAPVIEVAPPIAVRGQTQRQAIRPLDISAIIAMLYGLIAAVLLVRLFAGLGLGTRIIRRSITTGIPASHAEIRESNEAAAPVTAGVLRPVIVLPTDWRQWEETRLAAVLAHETSHISRRDPALQVLSALHRAILWASPLSWFLHRQIVRTAEEVSDDDAIARTRDPISYAETLLDFMQREVRPLGWAGVPMARYERPGKRIRRILDSRGTSAVVSTRRFVAVAMAGTALAYFAAASQLKMEAARVRAPFPEIHKDLPLSGMRSHADPPSLPLLAQATTPEVAADAQPRFEVASIKLCNGNQSGGVARSGNANANAPADSERLSINCESVKNLISYAWDVYAGGTHVDVTGGPEHLPMPIEGGPAWISSDRYRIEAKSEAPASRYFMKGPMLQMLLAERFKLKIHRDSRQVPGYVLTVMSGGPKLKPFREGECWFPGETPDGRPLCGRPLREVLSDTRRVWDIPGLNATSLANMLQRLLGRPLIDKTGITGMFDIHLEFGVDASVSRFLSRACDPDCGPLPDVADPNGAPSISTALQTDLGLKLEPIKASADTLVIDHIERPTEN